MSGWLDFFDIEITCPFCTAKIVAAIWEDGDQNREPIVIIGLIDGQTKYPVCGKLITDEELKLN